MQRSSMELCVFQKQGMLSLLPEGDQGLMGWKGELGSDYKVSCVLEHFTS